MSTVNQMISSLAKRLVERKLTVAVAESCTGGWIAQQMTALAGSSAWFECGVVSYSNAMKSQLLGVSEELILAEGAVSEAVVREMAEGILRVAGADLSVAVSGIAGPGGGSLEKPVGTVWLAWARKEGDTEAQCFHFEGDREEVRWQAVESAVTGLLKKI